MARSTKKDGVEPISFIRFSASDNMTPPAKLLRQRLAKHRVAVERHLHTLAFWPWARKTGAAAVNLETGDRALANFTSQPIGKAACTSLLGQNHQAPRGIRALERPPFRRRLGWSAPDRPAPASGTTSTRTPVLSEKRGSTYFKSPLSPNACGADRRNLICRPPLPAEQGQD